MPIIPLYIWNPDIAKYGFCTTLLGRVSDGFGDGLVRLLREFAFDTNLL